MTSEIIPRTYEDLLENPQLRAFATEIGWLRENQKIAVIPDDNGTPVILQPGEPAKTPEDWEENTPWEHLLGDTISETNQILKTLTFRLYRF